MKPVVAGGRQSDTGVWPTLHFQSITRIKEAGQSETLALTLDSLNGICLPIIAMIITNLPEQNDFAAF